MISVVLQRILVGIDGSPSSRVALDWATETAALHEGSVTVVAVSPSPVVTAQGLTPEVLTFPGSQAAEHRDTEFQSSMREVVGEDVPITVLHGQPAHQLVAAAEDADLLVVGGRRRDGVRALILGSVSRACLHHARSAVAVVHSPASDDASGRHGRVIVGIDGSICARRALQLAAEEARLRGATLSVVHVVHGEHVGFGLVKPSTRELLDWGEDLLATELKEADVTAEPVVHVGHAAPVLVRASSRADLLVLGSVGHSALAALTLGSTTDTCAQRARCPLLVVR